MRRIITMLSLAVLLASAAEAKFIPDPIVRYKIDARLDPHAKTIAGHETIVWRNHTSDTIPDLQFHLYLNAFKNDYSTFMREGGAESRRVKFRNQADSWGYEQVHAIKVEGADLTGKIEYIQPDDGNPNDQTVMRVVLPKPIPPQGSVTIEIDWTSKLPHVFARTGFHDNFFLVAQWFPKPGVYEGPGDRHRTTGAWNCHQFHTSTEFYADYGIFDVTLTVPSDFEIAATGANRHEHTNADGTTTWNYYQEDVHDFAWTTQPRSQVMKIVRWFNPDERVTPAQYAEWAAKTGTPLDQMKLTPVKVTLFLQREHASQADRHFRAAFAGLKWFGLMYGRYPYDVLTVVDPPYGGGGAGGMEYPTFFTAGTEYWPSQRGGSPEAVTVHEFGHQFWYGMVGNNEFEEAWLDEGFNSYSTTKTLQLEYGQFYNYERVFGVPVPGESWMSLPVPSYPWRGVGDIAIGQYWEWVPRDWYRSRLRGYLEHAQTDPMERFAFRTLNVSSYRDQAYIKPELTLHTLEALLGDVWPKVIRTYQQRWRFRHPDAQDFMDTVREVSGHDMKWFFDQTVYGTGLLNYAVSFTSGPAPARHGFFDQGEGHGDQREGHGDQREGHGDQGEGHGDQGKGHGDQGEGHGDQGEGHGDQGEGHGFSRADQSASKTGASAPALVDDKKEGPVESEVLVRRLGEMQFPVTVLVRFADGSQRREQWDGGDRWHRFKYAGTSKIVGAEIDPEFQWKLAAQRTETTYTAQPVKLAAEKWYLRWVTWLQNVFMAFSYFS